MNDYLFELNEPSNENIKVDLSVDASRLSSESARLESEFKTMKNAMIEYSNVLQNQHENTLRHMRRTKEFRIQCEDAWNSKSLHEMKKKRDLILIKLNLRS
jgi:hypothetical protein